MTVIIPAFVALIGFVYLVITKIQKNREFLRRRKAYVNGLKLQVSAGPGFREFFTIIDDRSYVDNYGKHIHSVEAVTGLKEHTFHIKLENNIVKELRKTIRALYH